MMYTHFIPMKQEDGSVMVYMTMRPYRQSHEKQMEILGDALCANTGCLCRVVGVPEQGIFKCEGHDKTRAIEHNLEKAGEILHSESGK